MKTKGLPQAATLRDAVAAIESARTLICAIVDPAGRLLGILSDGDIRRALLAGATLDSPASGAMTRNPIVAPADATPGELRDRMIERRVAALPLVDAGGSFAGVASLADVDQPGWSGGEGYDCAVIMAGGEGRRLRPLTLDRPKPMIDIGGMPLLERQVRAMVKGGLSRIFISTNYLGHVIEDHFGDGSQFDARIDYLREEMRLGTAGALSLLPAAPAGPVLVINGDVLTTCDFGHLLSFHRETAAGVTVAAVIYRVDIPYGVLRTSGHDLRALEEKPSQSFLCNAGIYVLSPDAVARVPAARSLDMTELLGAEVTAGRKVSVFPIHEYWSDIGSPDDLEKALSAFSEPETRP